MSPSVKLNYFVKYALLFSVTIESYTGFSCIMSKQWRVDPFTTSTSILAEFIPLEVVASLSETGLPHDDTFLNGIVYMVYFQQAVVCLSISMLGGFLILEMVFVGLRRYLRKDVDWLRDPLEVLDLRKRNSAEMIGMARHIQHNSLCMLTPVFLYQYLVVPKILAVFGA